jgi:flagellin
VINFSNTTASAITIGGTANPLGVTTVNAQTTGASPTSGSFVSSAIANVNFATVAGTGSTYDTGTLSSLDFSTTATTFTVDGTHNVTLSTDYTGNAAGLATDLAGQLGAGYTVAANGGADGVVITNTAHGSVAAAITAGTGIVFTGGTGLAGNADDTSANKTFTVDGTHTVTLTTDYTGNYAGLVTAVGTAVGAGYTVSLSGTNQLSIVNNTTGTGSTAPVIGGANAALLGAGTSVNGAAAGANVPGTAASSNLTAALAATGTATPVTLAAGDLTIAVGTGTAVDLAGSYASGQALADAINTAVNGSYASYNTTTHAMSVSSTDAITVAGTKSGSGTGNLAFTTLSATATNGSLNNANVRSAASANDTMLRVDAALTSVSTLRSTLGAIQNRFQSTINSLQAVAENLSASRGRIQDTDFAMETANLTRSQILQQAGTAMVAQANSAPQNVLSLLRG